MRKLEPNKRAGGANLKATEQEQKAQGLPFQTRKKKGREVVTVHEGSDWASMQHRGSKWGGRNGKPGRLQ